MALHPLPLDLGVLLVPNVAEIDRADTRQRVEVHVALS